MHCLEGHFLAAREPGRRDGDFHTTLRKLHHDAQLAAWLEQEGKVKAEVKDLFRNIYRAARPTHAHQPDQVFQVQFKEQTADRSLWSNVHNKAFYVDAVGRQIPAKTVRRNAAVLSVFEEQFAELGFAVVDKFLTDRALRSLLSFLQASSFYFYPQKDMHLVALLEDGLASPLLAQLADGLRLAFPALLGPLPLTGARAWKADNSPLGAGASGRQVPAPDFRGSGADSVVSLLLWMVPSSALNGSAAHALELRRRPPLVNSLVSSGACAADGGAVCPEQAEEKPIAAIKYLVNL